MLVCVVVFLGFFFVGTGGVCVNRLPGEKH